MTRAKLTERQQLIKAARDGQPVERAALPARVTCLRCGVEQWPDADGDPRYHLRAARPADAGYRADMPTMVPCEATSV
jgi:hypothetical protein